MKRARGRIYSVKLEARFTHEWSKHSVCFFCYRSLTPVRTSVNQR